ncbi:mucin-2 [Ceratobasidium sp. AG-Ba]|nr:mucin-2 [Ceratobasidium sp. AG-Ba]QRV98637.1 mucin-2 [Ceratobasidium sp. AG-Ba]
MSIPTTLASEARSATARTANAHRACSLLLYLHRLAQHTPPPLIYPLAYPPPLSRHPPPEPARVKLVDDPVPCADPASPGILVADLHPIILVHVSTLSSERGHDVSLPSRPSSAAVQSAFIRPIVRRSNNFEPSLRRLPSLTTLIRQSPKARPHWLTVILASELGSPVDALSGYGPPSAEDRKPVPPIQDMLPTLVVNSWRSRTFSFGRRSSVPGNPRNRLVKASPSNVPIPGSVRSSSVRDPSILGSPPVTGAFPYNMATGSHDGPSIRSRRAER